jgi:hypothetical protein
MLVQVQRPLRHARSVGPPEVPVWQEFESSHQPQEPRSVHRPHPVELEHGSVGLRHSLNTYAQLVQVP